MTVRVRDAESCVDEIISRLGRKLVVGTPLGIGKPNALLNALTRRARHDHNLSIELITALSLNPPRGKSELEERFLAPIRERVWGDYPRLSYLDDRDAGTLPDNLRVLEFYMRSGSSLGNPVAQSDYISANYTHVARDMVARGANLLLQAVSVIERDGQPVYSLSGNPDVTIDLIPMLQSSGRPFLTVAQVNRKLPWMGGRAEVSSDVIDLLLDDPALDHRPFAVPHDPVDPTAWAIGLRASALVKDGGTLQVGIGALGDAVCHALRLRQRENGAYRGLLSGLGRDPAYALGGEDVFARGLYIASELVSGGLFALFEDGIAHRMVYEDEDTQRAANAEPTRSFPNGTSMQGAFFLGSSDFYDKLRNLSETERARIDMTSVGEVNRIYTHYRLERLQRTHARFLNITMMATLFGSAVSDQLADGQVVSGVGGQHDFVNMAHQLPDGRSVLLLRSVHERKGQTSSNVVFQYPHATVARHMRDVFVTEYGVADLRARTDAECVKAMLAIADSRFQESLLAEAQRAGKVQADYRIPDGQRQNTPERIRDALKGAQGDGLLPKLPFGSELTDDEIALAGRLKKLAAAMDTNQGKLELAQALAKAATSNRSDADFALRHMQLAEPRTLKERGLAHLVRAAFELP